MKRNTVYLIIIAIVLVAVAIIVVPTMLTEKTGDDRPDQKQEPDDASESPTLNEHEQTALADAEVMTTRKLAEDKNRTVAELRASNRMTDERADEIDAPE